MKTDKIDQSDGLQVDDIEKLEEPNNLRIGVFELNEDKTLTWRYTSQKMNKNISEDDTENNLGDIHLRNKVPISKTSLRKTFKNVNKNDLSLQQDHRFSIEKLHVSIQKHKHKCKTLLYNVEIVCINLIQWKI